MVNKFCPMCGEGDPIRWYVLPEKPYKWVHQCKNCKFVWVEVTHHQKKLSDFL